MVALLRGGLDEALLLLGADQVAAEEARAAALLLADNPAALEAVVDEFVLQRLAVAAMAPLEEDRVGDQIAVLPVDADEFISLGLAGGGAVLLVVLEGLSPGILVLLAGFGGLEEDLLLGATGGGGG